MGRCKVCDRLVPIEAKELRTGSDRQREWYPREHAAENDDTGGRVCPGTRKAL